MRVTGAAVVAGVVGSPVTHSLSPLIQGAWIEAARLDAVYAPFAATTEDFDPQIRSSRRSRFGNPQIDLHQAIRVRRSHIDG